MSDERFEVKVSGDATDDLRAEDVSALRAALRAEDVRFGETFMMFDSASTPGFSLGEFQIVIDQAKDWAPVLIAYLVGRMGRKLTVTVDGVSITATSKEEIEKLVPLVDDLRKKAKGKKN